MKIAALCTVSTGLPALKYALELGVRIEKVIGLHPRVIKGESKVSGYTDIKAFCIQHGIYYEYVYQYSLKNNEPSQLINNIDLLWVVGWQRLIPENFIEYPRYGAIGAHGSCDGISLGRGRSPQNWALLMGATEFQISVFRITNSIDDGAVIASKTFSLSPTDSILCSYVKVALYTAQIVAEIYQNPPLLEQANPQKGSAEYFPKRMPEDGFIDWNMSIVDIHNQVRSLANPYPNARSYADDKVIYIKESKPIVCLVDSLPGTVTFKYPSGELLVAARDGLLLIEKYHLDDFADILEVGKCLKSVNMQDTVEKILNRFKNEFPNKKLNRSLKNFWESKGFEVNPSL